MPENKVRINYAHRAFQNGPCINCTERHLRCHSECTRYKEYWSNGRSEYEEYKKQKDIALYDAHDAITGKRKNRNTTREK